MREEITRCPQWFDARFILQRRQVVRYLVQIPIGLLEILANRDDISRQQSKPCAIAGLN